MPHITISCDTCIMDGTAACADCVVTHLLAPAPHERRLSDSLRLTSITESFERDEEFEPADEYDTVDGFDTADVPGTVGPFEPASPVVRPVRAAVVFDLDELRAMRVLAEAGLVPTLRHREAP